MGGMYAPQRQDAIADDIVAHGGMSVTELATRHGVSAETIRRDLDVLVRQQRLSRVHGGAVPLRPHSREENPVAVRSGTGLEAKARIARTAADQLPATGGSVIVDSGTTTAALAGALLERPDLTVVTNSVLLGHQLSAHPPDGGGPALRMLGGRVRSITQSVVGSDAVGVLRTLRADVAFLGTNGISSDFGFSTPIPRRHRPRQPWSGRRGPGSSWPMPRNSARNCCVPSPPPRTSTSSSPTPPFSPPRSSTISDTKEWT